MTTREPARLFPRLGEMDAEGFADTLYATAASIEETLQMAGATPGEDYTRLDLLRLAEPYVVELHRQSEKGLAISYPAEKVWHGEHD
ncbi:MULTISPECIES: hypothetical protein [Halomonas]|uniref:hypothetical protein n=1 Tax=Halomonas TaxID=2745 RepID=UPI0013C2B85E|nr:MULTISPECIES: hypothetical protein [Halomonas]